MYKADTVKKADVQYKFHTSDIIFYIEGSQDKKQDIERTFLQFTKIQHNHWKIDIEKTTFHIFQTLQINDFPLQK